ncbi:MAG: DUF1820 family protein [Gammaproteobacteria bacterium]|nr:DUF1820 family protein [Gammaproteobacteria bacterium]NIR98148.1 DUF1820 family protein [Gammaproteobacteria bacterium]NIT62535.1 DUF1820 family protein [Gammaproteobacteria bacterium]NIV20792.1 DUF1820 family protein [Gammaproteobacteria bacterium]NIY31115.1 DUF1820 family protein [Gammaproteobacteria bacterium]
MSKKCVYRIIFHNRGSIYELYARNVSQGSLYAFVEVEELIFGERSAVLVDPSEEKLKSEFAGVKRIFVPLQAVVRIDEVEKEGPNKIIAADEDKGNITPFPMPPKPPGPDAS